MVELDRPSSNSPLTATVAAIGGTVPCAHCRNPVDPLRATRVAIFFEQFQYFCSVECRAAYSPVKKEKLPTPVPQRSVNPRPIERTAVSIPVTHAELDEGHRVKRALVAVGDDFVAPVPNRAEPAMEFDNEPVRDPLPTRASSPQDYGNLLLAIALIGGLLTIALWLAGDTSVILTARLLVGWVSLGAMLAHALTTHGDEASLHPAVNLAAPLASLVLATAARFGSASEPSSLLGLAGATLTTTAASLLWATRIRSTVEAYRELVLRSLDVPARRVTGEDLTEVHPKDLRAGEEIVVGTDEVVPADGTIIAGTADVSPWAGAFDTATRSEGDHLVAGALVKSGRVRLIVSSTGNDRAWARVTLDVRRRADLYSQTARLGRLVAERGAPVAAGAAALLTFASNLSIWQILGSAIAAQAAFAQLPLAEIGAYWVARTVHLALNRGVVLRTPEAIDTAGRVTAAVFCARGTLLLGEPEIASIEAFGQLTPQRALELAAGAQNGSAHPTATAVLRAARQRGVRPDAVRSHNRRPGLGVTSIASDGQPLIVGSRGLMLREHISVALAEQKISDLEALGQTVLLVAVGGRLVGMLGLQDGLRPGARAAVQHLLDVGVEPILLSGDTRDTCEAIGRALDIDHVRPEIMPQDRGDEIRKLTEGGAVAAVIGRSPVDDNALANGDVSVSLATAGSGSAEWQIQLVSDDVRDAAFAIRLAHRCRTEVRLGLALVCGAAGLATLVVSLGLVPLSAAPVLGFVGGILALARWQMARE
jgi:Cu+-exporting ATPase